MFQVVTCESSFGAKYRWWMPITSAWKYPPDFEWQNGTREITSNLVPQHRYLIERYWLSSVLIFLYGPCNMHTTITAFKKQSLSQCLSCWIPRGCVIISKTENNSCSCSSIAISEKSYGAKKWTKPSGKNTGGKRIITFNVLCTINVTHWTVSRLAITLNTHTLAHTQAHKHFYFRKVAQ